MNGMYEILYIYKVNQFARWGVGGEGREAFFFNFLLPFLVGRPGGEEGNKVSKPSRGTLGCLVCMAGWLFFNIFFLFFILLHHYAFMSGIEQVISPPPPHLHTSSPAPFLPNVVIPSVSF